MSHDTPDQMFYSHRIAHKSDRNTFNRVLIQPAFALMPARTCRSAARLLFLFLFAWVHPNAIFAADNVADRNFTNPVVRRGADPWVIRWKTNYYFCQSRPDGVWVNQAARLEDIGQDHWQRIWQPPQGTSYSKQIWAPELHFLQDKWYVYVAADDGDNANHRMYVLEGTSGDPQKPFIFKGKIAPPDGPLGD